MSKHFYEFGHFRIDLTERVLLRDGRPVQLTPKAFETLHVLVQNCGHVVEKDELMNRVWPDTFVEEVGLARNISALRKVLEDGSDQHQYIDTVPKRGYRFRAEVREWEEGFSERSAETKQPLASLGFSTFGTKTQNGSVTEAPAVITETTLGSRLSRWIWVTASLAVLSAAGLGWWLARTGTRTAEVTPTVVPLTSYLGVETQPSFSPDGSQVAFSWNGEKQDNFDIYVKLIGPGSQLRLTKAPEADSCPAWSPDGRSIAFVRKGQGGQDSVYLVSALGPPERRVALISPTGNPKAGAWQSGLAWTPDGRSLVFTDRNSDYEPLGLFLLSVESGEKVRLTSPAKMFVDSQPTFSPDGRTLAFVREVATGIRDIYLLALSKDFHPAGEPRRLTFENQLVFGPVWSSDGREIVFSSGPYLGPNLFRIATSGAGKPQRLVNVGEDGTNMTISGAAHRLVYAHELNKQNIWQLEVSDHRTEVGLPKKLIGSTRVDSNAQFSPDGKRVVFNSNRTGSFEIWVCDADGSNAQPVTSLGHYCGSPHWSPDGERISFDSYLEGQWEVYVTSSSGAKPERRTRNPANDALPTWSLDGKWIYFASDRSGEYQVWKMPASGGEAIPVTRTGGFEALEAPESQWVYYTKKAGASSLWRMPRDGGEECQVLEWVDLRAFAVFRDGIYFVPRPDSAGRYSIQFFSFATERIQSVFTLESEIDIYLSVPQDGRRIIYSQIEEEGSDLMLVENFR